MFSFFCCCYSPNSRVLTSMLKPQGLLIMKCKKNNVLYKYIFHISVRHIFCETCCETYDQLFFQKKKKKLMISCGTQYPPSVVIVVSSGTLQKEVALRFSMKLT